MVKTENVVRRASELRLDVTGLQTGTYLVVPTLDGERKMPMKFIKK